MTAYDKEIIPLRNVNMDELVSSAIAEKTEDLLKKSGRRSGRRVEEGDLSAMFGIELQEKVAGSLSGPAAWQEDASVSETSEKPPVWRGRKKSS